MFQKANMTSERSRYLPLVTTLSRDASVFKSVAHLLKTTNAATPYSTLKVAILRLYSNADGEDLETSLNDCVRGDDKVSNYLTRLRSIFASRYCEPTALQEDIIKSRVLQSVDTPTRLALYSYEQNTNWLHMPTVSFLWRISACYSHVKRKYVINKTASRNDQ